MSAAEHNPSRRALLGVAVALSFDTGLRQAQPLLRMSGDGVSHSRGGEDPELSPGVRHDGRWASALAAYQAASAELRAFERRTAGAPWEAQEAVEREMDERLDALGPALRRLMRTPAPDLKALAKKIELMVDQDVGSDTGGQACLAALKRDARRLARG